MIDLLKTTRRAFLGQAAVAGLAAGTVGGAPAAAAAAPGAGPGKPRGNRPAIYPFALGDFQITTLFDGSIPQDLPVLIMDTPKPEIERLLEPAFQASPTEASINAFLIETGSRVVMIDAGCGAYVGGYGGNMVASLALAGYRPEQVTDILITHLHADHYGTLLDGERMVFPNATILLSRSEFEFFMNPANARKRSYDDSRWFQTSQKILGPYLREDRIRVFDGPTELLPGITGIPAPGHTPGHSFYRVQNRNCVIDICGDIVHVAAIQFPRPATTLIYDADPAAAAATRTTQLGAAAAGRRLIAGAHIGFPGLGHVRQEGAGYAWVPVDYCYRGEI